MSCAFSSSRKRRVCYYYVHDVANFHYGPNHPMKPHRLALTHSLVLNYGLLPLMDVYKPRPATDEDLQVFHTKDYLDFLKRVTPDVTFDESAEFAIYGDCPPFNSVYEFCKLYTGGSIEGAWRLNQQQSDICINWSGGLHHARKSEGSGFCYVNDIVLSIIELLRLHSRVLYVDIDIHHGDGVQDAFYHTDRVMTVSFHKYAQNFFPGTGSINEIGHKEGKYYAVNVPLRDGIDDKSYLSIFKPVISDVMDFYRPNAIVFQSGADSLLGDRIGNFNLTLAGHAECVRFVASYNLPMLVLGGGGYTIRNVARCWTNETSILLDVELPIDLPENDYMHHYYPDCKLQTTGQETDNLNTKNYLDNVLNTVRKNIRTLQHAPCVQMQMIPPSIYDFLNDQDDDEKDEYEEDSLLEGDVEYSSNRSRFEPSWSSNQTTSNICQQDYSNTSENDHSLSTMDHDQSFEDEGEDEDGGNRGQEDI